MSERGKRNGVFVARMATLSLLLCVGACGGGGGAQADGLDEIIAGADGSGDVRVSLAVTFAAPPAASKPALLEIEQTATYGVFTAAVNGKPLTGVALGCLSPGTYDVELSGRVEDFGGSPIVLGIGEVRDGTSNTCTQYRESDFNFLLTRGGTDLGGGTDPVDLPPAVDMLVSMRRLEEPAGQPGPWQLTVVYIAIGDAGNDHVVGMAGGLLDPAAATVPPADTVFRSTGSLSYSGDARGHTVRWTPFGDMLAGPVLLQTTLPDPAQAVQYELHNLMVLRGGS